MESQQRGFTLIEVVLAIAVGLIIIAGVSVGYNYAKRAAISDNQRKDIEAIKSFVEQAIAAQQAHLGEEGVRLAPPQLSFKQLQSLADSLASLKIDPYTGEDRSLTRCPFSGSFAPATSCIGSEPTEGGMTINSARIKRGSAVMYYYDFSFNVPFRVIMADGVTRSFNGWTVIETDSNGAIVAAEGGEPVAKARNFAS